jgi:nicotinate phosphoribosyltransferase
MLELAGFTEDQIAKRTKALRFRLLRRYAPDMLEQKAEDNTPAETSSDEKIAILKDRPDIKFSDFGTRRRFSYAWQKHVVERVATELPDNFVGTSNIYLAHELGLKPIGTFAHELPMVYAALADKNGESPLDGHNRVLQDWEQAYKGDLSTALTDTFTTDFFFADFTPEQADQWKSLRHDSGDPIEFGTRVIEFYDNLGIDPQNKTVVFSDGLDIDTIVELADYFKGRINVMFGWGTTLTNDLGVKANNFVMKAVRADGMPTVKLSDAEGKHTGPADKIELYKQEVARAVGHTAVREMVTV